MAKDVIDTPFAPVPRCRQRGNAMRWQDNRKKPEAAPANRHGLRSVPAVVCDRLRRVWRSWWQHGYCTGNRENCLCADSVLGSPGLGSYNCNSTSLRACPSGNCEKWQGSTATTHLSPKAQFWRVPPPRREVLLHCCGPLSPGQVIKRRVTDRPVNQDELCKIRWL
jgi:hypothetical protein